MHDQRRITKASERNMAETPHVIFKYTEEMQRRKESAAEELKVVKQSECKLQAQKEALLLLRKENDGDIKERQRITNAARENLPDFQAKKLFDNVFRLVDSCYHQELLILELKEQLTLAKALREEKDCSDLLQGLVDLQEIPKDVNPSNVLCSWYHQMRKHVQNRSIHLNCSADEDYFYNIRLASVHKGPGTCPYSVPRLSFETKHRGYCLHLSIEETRSSIPYPSTTHYAFTSDIHLEGLDVKGREYLERGQTADEFIMQVVWPLMEENTCG